MPTPAITPRIATQPRLLRVPEFRPCLSVEAVRSRLSYTEDEVIADIDTGLLSVSWNIGRTEAQRREVRVLAAAVDEREKELRDAAHLQRRFGWAEIEAMLFPARAGKPYVTSPDLCLAFACSSQLVLHLIELGDLVQLDGTEYGRGRYGAALVKWASVTKFLRDRRQ